eukprot:4066127-Amphidinium_carterae.2
MTFNHSRGSVAIHAHKKLHMKRILLSICCLSCASCANGGSLKGLVTSISSKTQSQTCLAGQPKNVRNK